MTVNNLRQTKHSRKLLYSFHRWRRNILKLRNISKAFMKCNRKVDNLILSFSNHIQFVLLFALLYIFTHSLTHIFTQTSFSSSSAISCSPPFVHCLSHIKLVRSIKKKSVYVCMSAHSSAKNYYGFGRNLIVKKTRINRMHTMSTTPIVRKLVPHDLL